jgi:hypothetical protein
MLIEFKAVSQHTGEPKRRYFVSDYFDLYVWENEDKQLVGFQLCYDKSDKERALSYIDGVFTHRGIDTGEANASENRTPILVADGVFSKEENLSRFMDESKMMDQKVAAYVIGKLNEFDVRKK